MILPDSPELLTAAVEISVGEILQNGHPDFGAGLAEVRDNNARAMSAGNEHRLQTANRAKKFPGCCAVGGQHRYHHTGVTP